MERIAGFLLHVVGPARVSQVKESFWRARNIRTIDTILTIDSVATKRCQFADGFHCRLGQHFLGNRSFPLFLGAAIANTSGVTRFAVLGCMLY